jgi:hypothetical protein
MYDNMRERAHKFIFNTKSYFLFLRRMVTNVRYISYICCNCFIHMGNERVIYFYCIHNVYIYMTHGE